MRASGRFAQSVSCDATPSTGQVLALDKLVAHSSSCASICGGVTAVRVYGVTGGVEPDSPGSLVLDARSYCKLRLAFTALMLWNLRCRHESGSTRMVFVSLRWAIYVVCVR